MSVKGFDISDLPSGSAKSASGANFSSLSLDSLSLGDNQAPPAAAKALPPVQITDSAPVEIQTLEPFKKLDLAICYKSHQPRALYDLI